MTESYIQVPSDDSGKKVRTINTTEGANSVHAEVMVIADGAGKVLGSGMASLPVAVSGQGVFLPSTQVVQISGQGVMLPSTQEVQVSGQGVFLPSTQVVKISGEQFVLASGAAINRGLLSGLFIIPQSQSGRRRRPENKRYHKC